MREEVREERPGVRRDRSIMKVEMRSMRSIRSMRRIEEGLGGLSYRLSVLVPSKEEW